MSLLALSSLFEYLYHGCAAIRNILTLSARGLSLYNVYRCQILKYKDCPRAERVKENVHSGTTQILQK